MQWNSENGVVVLCDNFECVMNEDFQFGIEQWRWNQQAQDSEISNLKFRLDVANNTIWAVAVCSFLAIIIAHLLGRNM
jgi:hypothetical protein